MKMYITTKTAEVGNEKKGCSSSTAKSVMQQSQVNNDVEFTQRAPYHQQPSKVSQKQYTICSMILVLLTAVLSGRTTNNVVVTAYSTGAGACPYNRSAVSGSHLDESGSKVVVRRGQQLKRLGLEFRIDGKPVNNNRTTMLDPNTDYTLELAIASDNNTTATAKSSSDGYVNYFKGALIRVEMLTGQGVFQFTPDTSDSITNVAIKCSLPAIGITHSKSKRRKSMKGTVNFQSFGIVQIDVTVVVENDNTTSNFAYTAYPNIKVRRSAFNSTPTPTVGVQTFYPTVTPVPTITQSPSYNERCYICGEQYPDYVVGNPKKTFEFVNVLTTCGALEETAKTRGLPPVLCDVAKEAVTNNGCNCVAPGTATTPTSPSTSTVTTPTVPTSYPTYDTKCYICGGNSSLVATSLTSSVTIPSFSSASSSGANSDSIVLTCERLQNTALSGRISPALCQTFITAVTGTAGNICGCQPIFSNPYPTVPITPSVPSPSVVVAVETFAPTLSRKPTISKAPVLAPEQTCYACASAGQTILSRDRTATYFGYKYTCGQLYDVQGRINNADPSCSTYQNTIQTQCGCQPVIDSPAPSVDMQTFRPTLTPAPSITAMPSYSELCYICGSANKGQELVNPDQSVQVNGRLYTCGQIYKGGLQGHIPPSSCPKFVQAALRDCQCTASTTDTTDSNGGQASSAAAAVGPMMMMTTIPMVSILSPIQFNVPRFLGYMVVVSSLSIVLLYW